jgi:hypothetical protein
MGSLVNNIVLGKNYGSEGSYGILCAQVLDTLMKAPGRQSPTVIVAVTRFFYTLTFPSATPQAPAK